jgi:streptogramin lyase
MYRVFISTVSVAIMVSALIGTAGMASAPAYAKASSAGAPGETLAGNPLVVPALSALDGGTQAMLAENALLHSPGMVTARERSRFAFRHEGAAEARATALKTFPSLISTPDGGLPELPHGGRLLGYRSSTVAEIRLPDGQPSVAESTQPLAKRDTNGHWVGLNLRLHASKGGFAADDPLVPVHIPTQITDPVQLAATGVSVTPVSASGASLRGSRGESSGAAVVFANSQLDADTVVKPTSTGIDFSAVLRSPASPTEFGYRVGIPRRAHLRPTSTGIVQVIEGGHVVTAQRAPMAFDATGRPVPLRVSVNGTTVVVSVATGTGDYQYPIAVDPEWSTTTEKQVTSNWEPHPGPGYEAAKVELLGWLVLHHQGPFAKEDTAAWTYKTEGRTQIYAYSAGIQFTPITGLATEPWMRVWLTLGPGITSREVTVSGNPVNTNPTLCATTTCEPTLPGLTEAAIAVNTVNFEGTLSQEFETVQRSSTIYIAGNSLAKTNSWIPTQPEIQGQKNAAVEGNWIGPHAGLIEARARDEGLGVAELELQSEQAGAWGGPSHHLATTYLKTEGCKGVQCSPEQTRAYSWPELSQSLSLVNGPNPVRAVAHSALPNTSPEAPEPGVVWVDSEEPFGIKVKGLPEHEGPQHEPVYDLTEAVNTISIEAQDGTHVKSSGVKAIAIGLNGREIGTPNGQCLPGPCTATGQFSVNGAELGAGENTLTVDVTDNANNVETDTFHLAVHRASPVSLATGSVNPESGDFALQAVDVNVSGGPEPLSVTRHFDSRNPAAGEGGALGSEWTVGLASLGSLEVLPDGSALVTGSEGATHFALVNGKFEAPEGDHNIELEYEPKAPEYLLKEPDAGALTIFTKPAGATQWVPSVAQGPITTNRVTAEYRTVKHGTETVLQPTFELGPHPQATCTRTAMAPGCRGLELVYDEGTTAPAGEGRSEWGNYPNQLEEVKFVSYNPATKATVHTSVAAYEYDHEGRLRAEWDPRISPSLKTTYGYDSYDHVAAITQPGHATWALSYGTIANDSNRGRLLKITQAPTTASPWDGQLPKPTGSPTIEGTPVVGARLATTDGTWANEPGAYAYEWDDCDSTGSSCTPILGATNPNYTVTSSDIGHSIMSVVTAVNAGGAWEGSALVGVVKANEIQQHGIGVCNAAFVATGPENTLWHSCQTGTELISETIPGIVKQHVALPSTGHAEGIVLGPDGNEWYADSGTGAIGVVNAAGVAKEYPLAPGSHPEAIVVGPDGNLWFTIGNKHKIGKITTAGALTEYPVGGETEPKRIARGGELLWFTSAGTQEIGHISTKGEVVKYPPLPVNSDPVGITEGSDGAMWYTDLITTKIGRITASGSVTEYPITGCGLPYSIATGSDGNMWFSCAFDVGRITPSGAISTYALPAPNNSGDLTVGLTTGPDHNIWYSRWEENGTDRSQIGSVNINPANAALRTPQPGYTIDYGVPLEGTQAPQQMGINPETSKPEPERWGQTDDPAAATAIFPPDSPQSWPATSYKRATVYYMDGYARTVNIAQPTGGISTTEYDSGNAVTRTLSGQNRATALAEPNPSAAAALLDTKTTYDSEGNPTQVLGPQHLVKVAHGKGGGSEEILARDHTQNFYDEGAAAVENESEEAYDVPTKIIEGAETTNKEEFDRRTTQMSYSGQNNLGWTLRKATSTTIDPGGLNLTTTRVFDKTSGALVETRQPADTGKDLHVPLAFSAQFGTKGTGAGQLTSPGMDALDAHGNVWVTESSNHRVDEFSASGAFVEAVGYGVSNGEAKPQICTTTCKAGLSGSSAGELSYPIGITVAAGTLYVTDANNGRVNTYNEKGEYLGAFGAKGKGAGQMEGPIGITASAANLWIVDWANQRLDEFTPAGKFIEAVGWGVLNGQAKFETCTTTCQAGLTGTGPGEFDSMQGITRAGGNLYVTDDAAHRVDILTEAGAYVSAFGTKGTAPGQLEEPIAVAVAGGSVYVTDADLHRVEKYELSGTFLAQFGTKGTGAGQFMAPEGITMAGSGAAYVVDTANNRIQEWVPADSGAENADVTKTVLYSAAASEQAPACGLHPEWAGLPCEESPTAQTGVSGTPEQPRIRTTYNVWNKPETVTESFGTATRTEVTTYDAASRPESTEETVTGTTDTPLTKVTDKYSASNGTLETQEATTGGTTRTIKTVQNNHGAVESYTDADGNTAHYSYDIDGRITKISDGSESANGNQTYGYNENTGDMTALVDSGAGAFGAAYNADGQIVAQTYPNGMTATLTRDATGRAVGIQYIKTTHCTTGCTWYTEADTPSIFGEVVVQSSTLARVNSAYDAAGRLSEVQETPAGEGCLVRQYAYDEASNRTSETSRAPGAEGKCATEGGSTEWHTYDSADRLTDSGIAYEALGNITKLPAVDSGGSALTSSYYVDGQVASQTQSEVTKEYALDPEDRTRAVISSGKAKGEVISHYDGSGDQLTWTAEPAGTWTREIPAIDGTLAATKTSAGVVELQIHDLDGDIVGTASPSETATKPLKMFRSTEYGVPVGKETPPQFAWLGANGVSTEGSASGTVTQDGNTYVPQTGTMLQTTVVAAPIPVNHISAAVTQNASGIMQNVLAAAARQVVEAEEEDPCTIVENEGSMNDELGFWRMKAVVKLKYCWSWRKVESVYGAGREERVNNRGLTVISGLGFSFLEWVDNAWWDETHTYYEVERKAVFEGEIIFCHKDVLECPGGIFRISFRFLFGPGYFVKKEVEYGKTVAMFCHLPGIHC